MTFWCYPTTPLNFGKRGQFIRYDGGIVSQKLQCYPTILIASGNNNPKEKNGHSKSVILVGFFKKCIENEYFFFVRINLTLALLCLEIIWLLICFITSLLDFLHDSTSASSYFDCEYEGGTASNKMNFLVCYC